MPQNELLIISYAKDFPWLRYALRSIYKFGTGFSGLTLVVPNQDKSEAMHMAMTESLSGKGTTPFAITTKGFLEAPGKGHLDHLAQNCMADLHCPEADFVAHTDSDIVFREPFTPEDYFVDGKPVLCIEPFDILETKHPGRYHWKQVAERNLGFELTHEGMCRPMNVYPKWLYSTFRNHIEQQHGTKFRDYVLAQKPTFPYGFVEYVCLTGFAQKFFPDSFHWIDVSKETRPRDKLCQMWSHGAMDKAQDIWIDGEQVTVIPEKLIAEILK